MNKCAGIFGLLFGHRFKEKFLFNRGDNGHARCFVTFCTRCGCEPCDKRLKEIKKAP